MLPNGWTTPTKVTKLTNVNPKRTTYNKSATASSSAVRASKAATQTQKPDYSLKHVLATSKIAPNNNGKYKPNPKYKFELRKDIKL